ncbi:MAG: hypothetical protein RIC14_08650 [Filomicrobium sp.]
MRAILFVALTAILCGYGSSANAELKDYQVGRLIMLKSECKVVTLSRNEEVDGSWTYLGTCSNESFYPDGIKVTCADPDNNDERACVIHTKAKQFDSLRLLQQPSLPDE